uniref:B30.2/SPRY domain-containing protein n=1 Tax=Haplochromis burtoni TaxID=8153 RepID=A0A3Q2UVQ7_HAPBU
VTHESLFLFSLHFCLKLIKLHRCHEKKYTTTHAAYNSLLSKMTFDPDTAHPRIVLSDDETEMTTADFIQDVPNNPRRFDVILGALGATGFSSGKHYWEVSVAGKTCYHLGMTSESSRRKGSISFSPNNDYWTIVLDKQGQYRAIEHRRTIPIPTEIQPVTLGILLDYKKGTISFYDSGSRTHINSLYFVKGGNISGCDKTYY